VIQVHVFRKGEELTDVPVADLSEVHAEAGTLVWVDAVGPDDRELDQLAEEFSLHPLVLDDLRTHRERPKLDEYPGHVLLVGYGARDDRQARCSLHEVDAVAGKQFVLSVHDGQPLNREAIARRLRAHPEMLGSGAGFLLYVLLDELVDTFFPVLDAIGERVEDLEETVFAGELHATQEEIFALRRDLVAIRRVAGPMRDAMQLLLRRDLGLFSEDAQRYLRDIYDHLIRVVESVEDYQDLAAGTLEAHLTVLSNKVNEVARTLTGYAAIFAAITLITGIYGMNFQHMPELGWRFGYAYALGLMVAAAGGLWWFFRRKDWL
jgi:magnesium transporter